MNDSHDLPDREAPPLSEGGGRLDESPIGPGVGKISTLQAIANNPGISQVELSEMFGRDRSLQFRIVADLKRREVDPTQKRRHGLYATALGLRLIPDMDRLVREDDRQAFGCLGDEGYAALRHLLRRVFLAHLGPAAGYWHTDPAVRRAEVPEDGRRDRGAGRA